MGRLGVLSRAQDRGARQGSGWLYLARSSSPAADESWRDVAERDVEALRAVLRRADASTRECYWPTLQAAQQALSRVLVADDIDVEAAEQELRIAANEARGASEAILDAAQGFAVGKSRRRTASLDQTQSAAGVVVALGAIFLFAMRK